MSVDAIAVVADLLLVVLVALNLILNRTTKKINALVNRRNAEQLDLLLQTRKANADLTISVLEYRIIHATVDYFQDQNISNFIKMREAVQLYSTHAGLR